MASTTAQRRRDRPPGGPAAEPAGRGRGAPPAGGADLGPLAACIERHERALRRCRKRFSEKSVHRLRIATRRLLAQIELVRPLVGARNFRRARRGLRRQLRASTLLRDAQVHLLQVRALLAERPELAPVCRVMEKNERCLRRLTARKLKGGAKLSRRLKAIKRGAATELGAPGSARRQREAVRTALLRAAGRLAASRGGPPGDPEGIHRLRVALKKFRYIAESLPAGLSVLTPKEASGVRRLLDLTGEMRDLELLTASVKAIATRKMRARGRLAPLWRALRREQAARTGVWRRRSRELHATLDAVFQADARLARQPQRGGPAAPPAARRRHP